MKKICLILATLALALPALAQKHPNDVFTPVTIDNAWSKATVEAQRVGAVFLTLRNETERDDALLSAESPAARKVEIHETIQGDNGMMQMRPMQRLPLPAGAEVVMLPGQIHIMLIGLNQQLEEGHEIPLTLNFASGLTQNVRVVVKAKNHMVPIPAQGEKPMNGHMHH